MKLPRVKKKLATYWNNSSVKAKVFLVFFFGVTTPILASNYLSFTKYSAQIEKMVVDSGFADIHKHARSIQSTIDSYKRTLIPLGGSAPVKGYNVAVNAGGKDTVPGFGLTAEQWKKSIDDMFASTAKIDAGYSQLRYINKHGYEISRVGYQDGKLTIVPDENLQYKGDRYYFTEGRLVPYETVYLSKMDLDREGNPPEIQTPLFPNLRFVSPVMSITSTGEFFGVVVANIHRDKILEDLDVQSGLHSLNNKRAFVIDHSGFFLKHPDSSMEFGGPDDLNTELNIRDEFPRLANKILSGKSGAQSYNSSLIAYAPVFPYEDTDQFWVVIEEIPREAALSSVNSLKTSLYTMLFGVIGILGVCFFVLAEIAKYAIEDSEEVIESITQIK